jgi:hypothetical protein
VLYKHPSLQIACGVYMGYASEHRLPLLALLLPLSSVSVSLPEDRICCCHHLQDLALLLLSCFLGCCY